MIGLVYKFLEFISVFVAGGGEFAVEENSAMVRVGIKPSIEISESFEALAILVFDFRIEIYDSFGVSFGLGYKF